AGVAGSALAYALGKDGRKVFMIERDISQPDRMAGELLQPGGYLKLVELGLADCVEDIDAQRVLGYALFKEGRNTKVGYPLKGYDCDVSGRSFHNGRFIQKMRGKASNLPMVTQQQGTVHSLIEEEGIVKGVKYRVAGGAEMEVYAPLTVICDGCFSNLRRTLCTSKPEITSCFVGLILENCNLPHANHGHVVLADPSPILLYPISSTEVRCLVDIPGEKVPSIVSGEMASYLKSVVMPQVPEELQTSFLTALERGKMRSMPNKSMPAFPVPRPGAILVGDAFNIRHPLTGGGMTVALSDVVLLRDLLKPLKTFHDSVALCDYLEKFYTLRKPVASTINTLAGALYKVFCASPDIAMKEMRQACFDYLSLGGSFSMGPVALFLWSGPHILIPFPSFKRVWLGTRLIMGAANIIFPIIRAEGVRQMFFPNTVPAYYKAPPAECMSRFSAKGRKDMWQACFDYLSLGGIFSTGPMALLSGLSPQPLRLLAHFCVVAVFGVGRILIPFHSFKRVWLGTSLIMVYFLLYTFIIVSSCPYEHLQRILTHLTCQGAANNIFPINRAEGVQQMFFPNTVPAYYKAPPAECMCIFSAKGHKVGRLSQNENCNCGSKRYKPTQKMEQF
ncbi:hypothetical protein GOP47_0028049, partial [Adiantum capillus-veneris]